MKSVWTVLCLILLLAAHGVAATCNTGSLASYIALGPGGCTIGSNTLGNFAIDPGLNGGIAINPSAVIITPLGGSFDPGISTTLQQSASGNIFEAIFSYQISGNQYTSETYSLSGSSEASGGTVTGLQNYCAGGVFGLDGVTDCTGVSGTLLTLDGVQNQDMSSFSLPNSLTITDDFTVDGTFGTASAGTLTDRFSARSAATPVPEPTSITIFTLFTAVGLLSRRRKSLTR